MILYSYVTITFLTDPLTVGDDVSITVEGADYLMDAAGNEVEDFDLTLDVIE